MISVSSESVYSNKLLIPVNSERGGGGGRGGASRRSPESRDGQESQKSPHQSEEEGRKEVERHVNEEGNLRS